MRFTFALLAALSLTGLAVSAHATTVTTINPGVYDLEGASINSYTVTGTVTLDKNGNITAADITFNDPTYIGKTDNPAVFDTNITGGPVYYYSQTLDQGQFYIHSAQTPGGGISQLELTYIVETNGSGDIVLTSGSSLSIPNSGVPGDVYPTISGSFSGTLDPAPTPEPSSLVLLGTGLMGLAGAAKRRLRKA